MMIASGNSADNSVHINQQSSSSSVQGVLSTMTSSMSSTKKKIIKKREKPFVLSFQYTITRELKVSEYIEFAFGYPFSYSELQQQLQMLFNNYSVMRPLSVSHNNDNNNNDINGNIANFNLGSSSSTSSLSLLNMTNISPRSAAYAYTHSQSTSSQPNIYFHRELLVQTTQGRRVDLLTITSFRGIQQVRETVPQTHQTQSMSSQLSQSGADVDKFNSISPSNNNTTANNNSNNNNNNNNNNTSTPVLFPLHRSSEPRAHRFNDKPYIFVSARVHPGETPSSLICNGLIDFLLHKTDPRAALLRDMFVWVIVPMLNPDGVALGHYRTDVNGVNLNRCYTNPSLKDHPSIFAAKHVIMSLLDDNPVATYPDAYPSSSSTSSSASSLSSSSSASDSNNNNNSSGGGDVNKGNNPNEYSGPTNTTWTSTQSRARSLGFSTDGKLPSWIQSHVSASSEAHNNHTINNNNNINSNSNSNSNWNDNSRCPLYGIDLPRRRLLLYLDLHAHANKKGAFIFGNHIKGPELADNMLFAKIMSTNSPFFDYNACNFSAKNMVAKDVSDGLSKEGSGRVALYMQTGLVYSYTLEVNYNAASGHDLLAMPPSLPHAVESRASAKEVMMMTQLNMNLPFKINSKNSKSSISSSSSSSSASSSNSSSLGGLGSSIYRPPGTGTWLAAGSSQSELQRMLEEAGGTEMMSPLMSDTAFYQVGQAIATTVLDMFGGGTQSIKHTSNALQTHFKHQTQLA
jgi:uncharacterized membrane protein YgcG